MKRRFQGFQGEKDIYQVSDPFKFALITAFDSYTMRLCQTLILRYISQESESICSRKRASLRERRSPDITDLAPPKEACTVLPVLVSIQTADGYMMSADCSLCHVRLCQQTTVTTNSKYLYVDMLMNNITYPKSRYNG